MNKGKRAINFIIDVTIISATTAVIAMICNQTVQANLLFLPIHFSYYAICESVTGQTIEKRITKTVVVDVSNSKPGIFRILLRTLLRYNPFDLFSYLFGEEQGAHDKLSKTRLQNMNN
jgi:uncharacterized RDD family membrane protein YckC